MTLIAVARRRGPGETFPAESPYNVPTYTTTPTPDGSGSVVHPDVIDFRNEPAVAGSTWNGWRYWMAVTPYFNTNDDLENPCILVSQDGKTWQVPNGLSNPVYPWPGGAQYNSDTDIAYNPEADELVLIYRTGTLAPVIARSANGVTWPPSASAISIAYAGELLSPALVRLGANSWAMYAVAESPRKVQRWTSTDLSTWAGPVDVTGITGMAATPWHLDVIRAHGRFWMLVNTYTPDLLYAASSIDGIAWTLNTAAVMVPTFAWDSEWIYRATLQPHESGDRFRVWYSARGSASWRVGYTQIPLTEWPAIP